LVHLATNMAPLSRRAFLSTAALAAPMRPPDKVVVLTFDDAVKSHRTFVAPLLKELGFRATFFVTHGFMADPGNYMTWRDIAEIHGLGLEIGNHGWTHAGFNSPMNAGRMEAELALVENELAKVGVPRPVTFGWCGNGFGPEAVDVLTEKGYRFARRGMFPEAPYGQAVVGAAYDPTLHHPLLVPSTGDAYSHWTLEHFIKVVSQARSGKIAVLQFHGVPDIVHSWVGTSPGMFRQYMAYLKQQNFRVIALEDLAEFADPGNPPADPLVKVRHHPPNYNRLMLPAEVKATRDDPAYWLRNMLSHHRFTNAEAAKVAMLTPDQIKAQAERLRIPAPPDKPSLRVMPYPGGRHPRIESREGAICPLRGTKASVFLPWDPASYVVVDLPEAIFSNLGLTFLAHTHFPTIWDAQNKFITNVDWTRTPEGGLESSWILPNNIAFGASVRPADGRVEMDFWLRNGTAEPLQKLRTQICVMLKGAPEFTALTNRNKMFSKSSAAVRSESGDRWIVTAWQRTGRVWGNSKVPCLHADPVFADCAPGSTVRLRGRLWFYQGADIRPELARADAEHFLS
jgi:peptidoglycan/xylan/chitin deacetylase (PgdA/CDA1 family)